MRSFSPAKITPQLKRIRDFFDRHSVDYLLVGAFALGAWGQPRTTLDIDFLVLTDARGLDRLKRLACEEGFEVDHRWMRWNPLLTRTQIRIRSHGISIDLMIPKDAHDRKAFERGKRKKWGACVFNVVSPEDFILQKLKVGRPRDFEDAVTVLERMRGRLDRRYLKRWAAGLGLRGGLSCILRI